MLKIHFLLRQPKRKGRKAIYATVRYQNETAILYPKLVIHSDDWINKNGINKPRDIPENSDLKQKLLDYENLITDTHTELQKVTIGVVPAELLKNAVYGKNLSEKVRVAVKIVKEKPVFIADFFQTMIDDSKNKKRLDKSGKIISIGTIQTYVTTKMHFEDFELTRKRKYKLTDINQNLIDDYSNYLNMELEMAFNTSGKHMKTLRTLLHYARKKKLISAEALTDIKITVTKEATDSIYLTEPEIETMFGLKEFETDLHEIVHIYFIIGCKSGMRYSDFSRLNWAKINSGFIHMTQKKTLGKVTIPVHPMVEQIFAKYPNGLPECPNNQVFNKLIKEIGQKIPELDVPFDKTVTRSRKSVTKTYKKWELLMSHSCRRSFATNEYLNGTPTITIMAITGHESEKSFMAYIRADSLQHAILLGDSWRKRAKDNEEHAA